MEQLNEEAQTQPGYISKNISKSAINFIEKQRWPGNIRELWNTLLRASIWSDGSELDVEHLERAMIQRPEKSQHDTSEIDVRQGIDINEIIDKTKRYYVDKALDATAGQKEKQPNCWDLPTIRPSTTGSSNGAWISLEASRDSSWHDI